VLDQVLNALNGFDVLEFGGIEPNPSYETLMNAVKIAREENVTFLLAVGGGSVLDGTKFIAAAAHYDENVDPWEILETYGSNVKSAIPMGSVLTLPATGSESNKGAVISRKTTGDKRALCLLTSSRCSRSSIRFTPIPCRRVRWPTAWLTHLSIPLSSTSPTRLTAKFRIASPKAFC
jgi:alcohol dehydrogenase YqhD (iron-dependent ADH family)